MLIRQQFPDLFLEDMLPALDEITFQKYKAQPRQFPQLFKVLKSTRPMEQTSSVAGMSVFGEVGEGEPVKYDTAVPGFNKTYLHSQWGSGFKISRIMADDDRFGLMAKFSSDLGRAANETVELSAASVFNRAFNASYAGPDGKALCATDHPLVKQGGTQANKLTVAADLDIAAIELALIEFRGMKDPAGKRMRVKPNLLVVPRELEFAAVEILAGDKRSDTANNTVNAFKNRVGYGPFNDIMVYEYLTDPDAWFILADKDDTELRFYWREKFDTVHDVDFDTRSIKTAGWMRFSHGFSGYEGVFGSEGA